MCCIEFWKARLLRVFIRLPVLFWKLASVYSPLEVFGQAELKWNGVPETSRQCARGDLCCLESMSCLWLSLTTHHSQSHTLTVKRLRWRPRPGRAGHGGNEERAWVQLASAGADHVVKIFNIKISALWLHAASGDNLQCVPLIFSMNESQSPELLWSLQLASAAKSAAVNTVFHGGFWEQFSHSLKSASLIRISALLLMTCKHELMYYLWCIKKHCLVL